MASMAAIRTFRFKSGASMCCICDFCSAPNPTWKYPARSFIGYEACGIAGESVGDWAACEECHRLIATNDRVGLTERSAVTFIALRPELTEIREELTAELGVLHTRFLENRTGEPSPLID